MDLREVDNFYFPVTRFYDNLKQISPVESELQLESDSQKRDDSIYLKKGDIKVA